jgi:dTMP kinase
MKKNTYAGLFISFEGLDGSGSSIQASLLSGVLKKEGYRVFLTKEPTNGLIGGLIRAQLSNEWKADQECLQLLFAADRSRHIQTEIIPNLENGKIVITDRYDLSSVAYGGIDMDNTMWLEQINDKFLLPDITFLIKVSPKICAMRLRKSQYNLGLFKQEEKLEKVWKIYEKIAKNNDSVYVIDGERDEVEVIGEILDITKVKLGVDKDSKK